jgi:hypothetical protein
MDEFQLILNVALIILFLKGLDDFGVFFLFELNVHMFDVLFEQLFVLLIGLGVGLDFEGGEEELLVQGVGGLLLLQFFVLVLSRARLGLFDRFLLFLVFE